MANERNAELDQDFTQTVDQAQTEDTPQTWSAVAPNRTSDRRSVNWPQWQEFENESARVRPANSGGPVQSTKTLKQTCPCNGTDNCCHRNGAVGSIQATISYPDGNGNPLGPEFAALND
jgi:hypothetical protein